MVEIKTYYVFSFIKENNYSRKLRYELILIYYIFNLKIFSFNKELIYL